MPFSLYEYDAAFTRFFGETMHLLARAHSPLLAQMPSVETTGTVGSRVRTREGMDVELPPGVTEASMTSNLNAVRAGDYDQLHVAMYESAESMAEQLVGYFIEGIDKVTEGTGNVVDVGGRPFSFDVLYETLEKMEFSLDENDELVMPSLVMNPAQAEKLRDLPPLTEDQQRKLDDLKQRKKTEALARRRGRRLS